MKWFRKDRNVRPDLADHHHDDGADAVKEAEKNLAETEAQWDEVRRVSASLRNLRKDNHFAQSIEAIFKGHA
jgi:hypothetical protein